MYVHPTYAVTPGREPLGVIDAWMWAREKRGADGVRPGQKESTLWIEGYERIAEMAGGAGRQDDLARIGSGHDRSPDIAGATRGRRLSCV